MFKKRRVKKEFDIAVAEGDDGKIASMLKENSWLSEYQDEGSDETDMNLKRVCAAIGIMEDELTMPPTLDDIVRALESDFGTSIAKGQLESICMDLETKGYIKAQAQGYALTTEGNRICDNFLNKQATDMFGEIETKAD
jgi:hypothetical protein